VAPQFPQWVCNLYLLVYLCWATVLEDDSILVPVSKFGQMRYLME